MVHSLAESGQLAGIRGAYRLTRQAAEIQVPETVQAVLSARIDRQGEREKQVLQMASVIGKTFSEGVLARIAELDLRASLEALKAAEFIYESSIYPQLEYAFKHPLTQEVAYGSQLGERRQKVHAAVARSLAEMDLEKVDERAALIAHHWEAAGEALEAASWHRRAAEWAGMSDIAEAQRHWQRVRRLCQEAGDAPESASLGIVACREILMLGWRLGLPEEEEGAVFSEGKRWIDRAGRPEEGALLEGAYSLCRTILRGDLRGGLSHGRAAEKLAEEAGNTHLVPIISRVVIWPLMVMGHLDEVRTLLDRMIEASRDGLDAGVKWYGGWSYVVALYTRGVVECYAGDLEQGRQMVEQGIELARARGELELEGLALFWFGHVSWISSEIERGLSLCRRSLEIAERFGSTRGRDLAYGALGRLLALNGQHDEAVDLLERALNKQEKQPPDLGYEALAVLAEAYLAAGDLVAARRTAEEGIQVGRRMGARISEAHSHRALARTLLRQEGQKAPAEIDEALNRADALYTKTGARNFKAFVLLERAELARIQGDNEARERELEAAIRLFREMKAPIRVQEVEQLLAEARQGPAGPPQAG